MPRAKSAPPPEAPAEGADAAHPLAVSALNRWLKGLLEAALPPLWVRGEISNFRRQGSGHCYFDLKDAGGQVAAVLFRGDAERVGFPLANGRQVVALGRIDFYEARGSCQLVVRQLVEDGVGRLQEAFERLKRQLAAEGLFDPARKRPVPRFVRRVAFITSPTGAALRDFAAILRRRGWPGRLLVLPARVQGVEAAPDLVAMLQLAANLPPADRPEVVVLGRGGGSIEDLWPFNEEAVARAVAASPLPTISAVGHEIDFVLTDFAADLRAETPSAAAEFLTSNEVALRERLARARRTFDGLAAAALERAAHRLQRRRDALERHHPQRAAERAAQRLDDLAGRLGEALAEGLRRRRRALQGLELRLARVEPAPRAAAARARLERLELRLANAAANLARGRREALAGLTARWRAADPTAPLERGFALVRDAATGEALAARAAAALRPALRLTFRDGDLDVRPKVPGEPTPPVSAPSAAAANSAPAPSVPSPSPETPAPRAAKAPKSAKLPPPRPESPQLGLGLS